MSRTVSIALRVLIAIFFLIAVAIQFVAIPGLISIINQDAPEFSHLAIPYGGSAFLAFVCVQVVLVAVWMLLGMVHTGAVFSERAFKWVNIIIGATWVAAALAALPLGLMLVGPGTEGSPVALVGIVVVFLGGTAIALMMTVMKALLRQATDARAELSEVI